MAITAFDGPLVTFPTSNTTGLTQSNPQGGPSIFTHGVMLADQRAQYAYAPGNDVTKGVFGWLSLNCQTLDQVPYTTTVNNLAGAQTATAGTALTLRSASATGVTSGVTITSALTGQIVTGLLAIDSAMTAVAYGSAGTVRVWNPTTALSRTIRIWSNGNDTTGTFVVAGYDIYNFPLSQTVTGAAGAAGTAVLAETTKAFKYLASVTPAGTLNSTGVTVGTGDTFGLPLRADRASELSISLGNTAIVASTGFTAAVTTTATVTSGDVRGTYGLQSSSNGVLRLVVYQSPLAANVSSTAGITGVNQI